MTQVSGFDTAAVPAEVAVAKEYAAALCGMTRRGEGLAEAVEELQAVAGLLDRVPKFEHLLASGVVDRRRRQAFVDKVFEGRVSDNIHGLLGVMARHGRLALLREVARQAREILRQVQGEVPVTVFTAQPTDEATRRTLAESLGRLVSGTAVLDERTDPELLGGLTVQVGARLYDASLAARFKKMRRRLGAGRNTE